MPMAGSAVAAGGGAQAAPRTTTGDITKLGLSHVSVGLLTCLVPTKSMILSGHFALGERVTIDCLGNVLRLIKHRALTTIGGTSPSTGSNTSTTSGAGGTSGTSGSSETNVSSTNGASSTDGTSSSVVITETATSGNATATSVASASSGTPGQMTTSTSAEGPVTATTPTSISIGAATCPYDRASYPAQSPVAQLQVGDVAKIDCETNPDGTATGSVSVP
jgi:hypothetical protein